MMKHEQRKHSKSPHFGHGTHFGKSGIVRIKLSDRDLVLIAGIAVAVIIALTTFLFESNQPQKESTEQAKPTINLPTPLVLINKIGEGFIQGLW